MDNNSKPMSPVDEGGLSAPSGDLVTVPRAELEALLARLEATASMNAASGSESFLSRPEDQATSDPIEATSLQRAIGGSAPETNENLLSRELAARDQRLGDLERTCKAAILDRELATALSGQLLVSGAAPQLLKLWRDEFDVYEENGSYRVASRDGRGVGPVVSEWLASREYSHFCLPAARGGTGARNANRPTQDGSNIGGPKNLGEAVVMKWREESVAKPNNFLKPIGLRRNR